tara:strand:- start:334 stop:654 length:321 start_codon:yes stop_codon:yes gene_type:complete
MKISQQKLKQIIREELQKVLKEADDPYFYTKKIGGNMQNVRRGIDEMMAILSSQLIARYPQTKAALKAYENLEVANNNAMKITQPIFDAIRKDETKQAAAEKGKAG